MLPESWENQKYAKAPKVVYSDVNIAPNVSTVNL